MKTWDTEFALEELIVKKGRSKLIPAGIHPPYSRIIIEDGARLVCEKSNQWLMLYSKGDFILEGALIYRDFQTGLGSVQAVSPNPDNQSLNVIYPETSKGGAGANSYPYRNRQFRGRGASGTSEYGGGGASGRSPLCNRRNSCKSFDALGFRGGQHPIGSLAKGGAGGKKRTFQNGGSIYIKIDGKLIAGDGRIDVTGTVADHGKAGEDSGTVRGPRGHVYNASAGMGGGGGPGGDGGLVVIKIDAENILSKPRVSNYGGEGGGRGDNGRGPTGRRYMGQLAKNGDNGSSGQPTVWITGW